jgi:hypothetical protein
MDGCFILLAVVVVVVVIWFINTSLQQVDSELKQRQERNAQEKAAHERKLAEKQKTRNAMDALSDEALRVLEGLPFKLESAERHLDSAKSEFTENAFAPFWDAVERAAIDLAEFDQGVHGIEQNVVAYNNLAAKCEVAPLSFAISRQVGPKLMIAQETTKRMHEIVRQAQRNFQFAMIYEQRKTNQILVAGFRSLAQVLDEMTWRITSSLNDMKASIDRMDESLDGIRETTERIAADSAAYRKEASARAARQEKALEMLDNIQRRRYPSAVHGGLR